LHHKYDLLQHATIGGLDFYVDTWSRSNVEKIESGSDREHIDALIHAKGYKIPAHMMYVRPVNLLDSEKRKGVDDYLRRRLSLYRINSGGSARGKESIRPMAGAPKGTDWAGQNEN
jgi:hypothetical protein